MRLLRSLLFAAGCCLGGICAGQTTVPAARPNIVFIDADDLGYGDLACHGHQTILTPHIDRLAREGTDFQSFLVVNPVCSPSRVSIVTGRFPSRFGVHQHFATHAQNVARGMPDWLDPQAPLLPRLLREAGYRTAHYGKWHLSGGGIAAPRGRRPTATTMQRSGRDRAATCSTRRPIDSPQGSMAPTIPTRRRGSAWRPPAMPCGSSASRPDGRST